MRRYYITNRKLLGGVELLIELIRRHLAGGVDLIQIREKDLDTRDLLRLTRCVLELPNLHGARILVNSRVDVALASGAHGVHLPGNSIAPARLRSIVPAGFLIGVSCHEIAEVRRAEAEGADLVVYGPMFPPRSKSDSRPAKGVEALEQVCRSVRIPVYALGGVTEANAPRLIAAGAAGVAGISLFQTDYN